MGTEVPDDWPPIYGDKWYKVTVAAHIPSPPYNVCSGPITQTFACCQIGSQINNWIKCDWQCSGIELCVFSGYTEQRIVNVEGPFDDQDACLLELP